MTILTDHDAKVSTGCSSNGTKLNGPATTAYSDDTLRGAEAIGEFLGLTTRQVYHLAENGSLPVHRLGSIICMRKSTWAKHVARQEAKVLTVQEQ